MDFKELTNYVERMQATETYIEAIEDGDTAYANYVQE